MMARSRRSDSDLLTGEWACLGLLCQAPTHGFALAQEMAPGGEIGRIWSLSRPLTYRAVEQLQSRGYIEPCGEEPGLAGGNRTVFAPTRTGRAAFRTWVKTPVAHLRDLRSELLLKLTLGERCAIPLSELFAEQRRIVERIRSGLIEQREESPRDLVVMWRIHSVEAALEFLADLDRTSRRRTPLT